ncbi:hypothetical protein KEM48_004352 [Puccinia striiformis f. sp. tritici PST-130]|nr:hypothetical protein KEM48_004352 [Puccinia striiformis f. sp. tritici PST-130]
MVFGRIYLQRSQLTNISLIKPRTSRRVAPPEVYSKPINRTIMMSDHLNATGLSPEESRKLKSRSERDDEKTIIRCLKELYSCKPSEASYEMYAENATFHDPLTIATPLSTIKSQFNGMPKMFSSSTIDKFEDITYYRSGSKFKTLNSLITLERDPKGKVIRHTEEWSHDKVTDKSDGFIGQLNEWRKKAAAEVIAKLVPEEPPKDKQS